MGDRSLLRHRVGVVGVGTTPLGLHPDASAMDLALRATRAALAECGIDKGRLDGILCTMEAAGGGGNPQALARLLGVNPRVAGTSHPNPAGFAFHDAVMLIATGVCDVVLCATGRKPPFAMQGFCGPGVVNAEHGLLGHGAIGALGWTAYEARYGRAPDALGHVAVAAREHAALNPEAAFREPLTLEQYHADEHLIWPLRSLDLARVTDGGAAVVLASAAIARTLPTRTVYVEGLGRRQALRTLADPDQLLCFAMRDVAAQVYGGAGVTAADIDVLQIYDSTTPAVIHSLENYGFCGEGEGPAFVASGAIARGGSLPVNTHGGHLSGGYLGGWSSIPELVRQLRGECGERQVAGAQTGLFASTEGFREHLMATLLVAD